MAEDASSGERAHSGNVSRQSEKQQLEKMNKRLNGIMTFSVDDFNI